MLTYIGEMVLKRGLKKTGLDAIYKARGRFPFVTRLATEHPRLLQEVFLDQAFTIGMKQGLQFLYLPLDFTALGGIAVSQRVRTVTDTQLGAYKRQAQ